MGIFIPVSILASNSGNSNSGNTTTTTGVSPQPGRGAGGGGDHWRHRGPKHPSRPPHHCHKPKKRHHCG